MGGRGRRGRGVWILWEWVPLGVRVLGSVGSGISLFMEG